MSEINYKLTEKYRHILEDIQNNNAQKYSKNIKAFNTVNKSELFDEDYYFSNYKLNIPKEYSLLHYLDQGYKEGKNPSKKFNGVNYLKKYRDVKDADYNPLVHYLLYGQKEEKNDTCNKNIRAYKAVKESGMFDYFYYIKQRGHGFASERNGLLHYLDIGYKLGFNPNAYFDGNEYLKNYPKVKKADFNPLVHYILYGKKEGRTAGILKIQESILNKDSIKNYIAQNRVIENLNLLRSKVRSGKKVNVVFILPAMMFVYEELYKLFENDELFNVQIVLVPHRLGNSKIITDVSKDKYYQIFSFLKEKNYNVISGFDFDTGLGIDLETTCKPDIIFYILPYMRIYPTNMKIENLPSNILYAYIPYGEFIENDLDDNLYNFGWNERIWKIFCSTEEYLNNSVVKSPVGSSNVILSGSARMDSLINFEPSDGDYEWIHDKKENVKRIIWAPHHSLARPNVDEKYTYSTFDENYKFFYEYAKNNPDIEWVLRPHPLLKEILSEVKTYMKIEGIANKDFADDYFFKWNSLPNASVHEEIDYTDLFATADAMITDCVSFKSEYLYANKPGLILKRNNVVYQGYKGEITNAWYIENGSDFDKISKFIEDVVVGENDYLKDKREEVFKRNFSCNLGKASKYIFDYIKNELI